MDFRSSGVDTYLYMALMMSYVKKKGITANYGMAFDIDIVIMQFRFS